MKAPIAKAPQAKTAPTAKAPISKAPMAKAQGDTSAHSPQAKCNGSESATNAYEQTYIANCRKYIEASNAYYIDSHPIMDDGDFDKLAIDIKSMLALHPELARLGNPLATVQSDHVDGFKKASHSYPMLSLEDIYTDEELTKFVNSTGEKDFSVECKLDGLSLSLVYDIHGELIRAVTRGDGSQGDDVTAQARCIPTIQQHLGELKFAMEIRGEVVMPWTAFNAYNDACTNDKDKFANPRNAASGTLKSHDPNKCRERGLLFVAYYAHYTGADGLEYRYPQGNTINTLSTMGFNTPADYNGATLCQTEWGDDLMTDINKIKSQDYPFPIDGVVVKCNDAGKCWDTLGYTDRFYKWGIAFKFKQESLQSRLLQVNWQLADSGRITPVAIYEPIQMFGTTCQRATLNNPQWIEQNLPDLRIGDTLLLTKGGEIIPKVTGHIPHQRTIQEERKELIMPHEWTEDLTVTPPTISQTFGKVTPPDHMNGKPTYRNGAYLQIDVEPKPIDESPTKRVNEPPMVTGSSLSGKTILVSGNFGTPQIRKDIERTVIEQGGKLAKGVALSVDYYVLPDDLEDWKHKAGSKWEKIQSYMHQSRIITKDQFYSLIH